MTVTLPRDLEAYVADRVAKGASRSADEAVIDALRLLRNKDERQEKINALREEVMIGIESADRGETAPLDVEEILAEVRRRKAEQRKGA